MGLPYLVSKEAAQLPGPGGNGLSTRSACGGRPLSGHHLGGAAHRGPPTGGHGLPTVDRELPILDRELPTVDRGTAVG